MRELMCRMNYVHKTENTYKVLAKYLSIVYFKKKGPGFPYAYNVMR